MEEDQNSEETQEVTPLDQDVADQHVESEEIEQQEDLVEEKQERNWRELRKKAEDADRRAQEYEQKSKNQEEVLKAVLSQMQQNQQPQQQSQPQQEVDELADVSPDEYLSYEQSRKAWMKDARQAAREEFLAQDKERERSRFKDRLKSQYSDFDDVVNDNNIAQFDKQEPELAGIIAKNKDPYEMGLLAYHHIKSKGFYRSDEESIPSREVSKKLEKSSKTVQSPSSYNKRPIAAAFSTQYMTDDQKSQLREEMERCAARANGY